jgi:protein-tyrosine phosphatase
MALNLSEIIPGRLWVGGYVREEEVPRLRRMGISAVVNLQTDEDLLHHGVSPDALALAYEKAGIELRRLPIPDFSGKELGHWLPAATAQVAEVLADPAAKLYLHCTAGVNRSPTAAAGYLIKLLGISPRDACSYLVSRRDCDPTLEILENYEALIRK